MQSQVEGFELTTSRNHDLIWTSLCIRVFYFGVAYYSMPKFVHDVSIFGEQLFDFK